MALIPLAPGNWINDGLVDRVTYTREQKSMPMTSVDDFVQGTTRVETVHTLTIYLSRVSDDLRSPAIINDPAEITRLAAILGIQDPIGGSSP